MTKFLFYDTETTGANVRFDQVLQFAAIVTDENFEELETVDLRCNLLPYMTPSPDALLVTGVRPAQLNSQALSHFEMARAIHALYRKHSPAIFIGHNTIKFDEEIMRQTFWQCLLDPYPTSTRGNIRSDLLPILRLAHAVDPSCILVATSEKGNPSFKLDKIATMNGFPNHAAHDALGDVRATIFMAKLVKERSPKVWNLMTANSDPKRAQRVIDENRLFRMQTYFGSSRVLDATKLASQPSNPKQVCAFDLAADPKPFLDMSTDELVEAIAAKESPFRTLRTNALPAAWEPLALPLAATEPTEREALVQRLDAIHAHPTFKRRVAEAMELRAGRFGESTQVEEQIYGGFPSQDDKNRMIAFHDTEDWGKRAEIAAGFEDQRLRILSKRLLFSHAPETLSPRQLEAMTKAVVLDRILTSKKVPWTTLSAIIDDLDQREETPALVEISIWAKTRRDELLSSIGQAATTTSQ